MLPASDIRRAGVAAIGAAAWVVACVMPHGATAVRDEPLHPELPPVPEAVLAPGTPLPSHPGLSAVVRAPARTPYELRAFGGARVSVDLRLLNRGDRRALVAPLELSYAARREGVPFACGGPVGPAAASREPTWLAPGQSFSYERDFDCALPLPGDYEVTVFARVNPGGDSNASAEPEVAGVVHIAVEGSGQVPQPVASRPGLFVTMSGPGRTVPLPPEAWVRGDYRISLGFINGGQDAVPLGPARLSFFVYHAGTPLPCSGDDVPLNLPAELQPGEMRIVQAPVACAPGREGKYVIVGRLRLIEPGNEAAGAEGRAEAQGPSPRETRLADDGRRQGERKHAHAPQTEFEAGKVGLEVTQAPWIYTPRPRTWPSLEELEERFRVPGVP